MVHSMATTFTLALVCLRIPAASTTDSAPRFLLGWNCLTFKRLLGTQLLGPPSLGNLKIIDFVVFSIAISPLIVMLRSRALAVTHEMERW
jgi:hypothetical protein